MGKLTFVGDGRRSEVGFRISLVLGCVVLAGAMWLSTGTMAPYAVTTPHPLVDSETGYLLNVDDWEFRATYAMLTGESEGWWRNSIALRRILYPIMAFPFMQLMGFHVGGVVASVLLNMLAFVAFVFFLHRKVGVRAAMAGTWLLATYPGITYWAGLPYSYAVIVPCTLVGTMLLWDVAEGPGPGRVGLDCCTLGILCVGYDLLPFFGPALIAILLWQRRIRMAFVGAVLIAGPSIAVLVIMDRMFGIAPVNSNTLIYLKVTQSYLRYPDLKAWATLLRDVPRVAVHNYLFSNFLFIPLLAAVVAALRAVQRLSLPHPTKAVVLALVLTIASIFLFNNLAPPYQSVWQMRGEWIARIYQPVIAALLLYICYDFQQRASVWHTLLVGLIVVADGTVAFGPALMNPVADQLLFRFYGHGAPGVMLRNLMDYGRRPLGF